ncbi:prepilin peptidase [Propioniciclava soli]|uniref:prepilin peptidase n=1 Tax=Propioniciclava soli TaxID=2775081 RepID=UPI001E3810FC|nr:prepilin peptidase [Propioniciclava soli]
MTPAVLTATLAATLAGGLIGEHQRRRLTTLAYRYPEETPDVWPLPGPRRWVPVCLAATLGLLTWRYTSIGGAAHLLHLVPLALAAPWLAAVDVDVHRLPYRTTVATLIASVAGLLGLVALTGQWQLAGGGALGWVIAHGAFWALHKIGGGMGYGDVRLAGLIGLTTAPLGIHAPIAAFLIGTLAATAWALTRPRDPAARYAYGPWLLLGWTTAILLATL